MNTSTVIGVIGALIILNFFIAERSSHYHAKFKEARQRELEAKENALRWREAVLAQNRGLKRQSRKIFGLRSKITSLEFLLAKDGHSDGVDSSNAGGFKGVVPDNRDSRVGRRQVHALNGKAGPSPDQQAHQGS